VRLAHLELMLTSDSAEPGRVRCPPHSAVGIEGDGQRGQCRSSKEQDVRSIGADPGQRRSATDTGQDGGRGSHRASSVELGEQPCAVGGAGSYVRLVPADVSRTADWVTEVFEAGDAGVTDSMESEEVPIAVLSI